MGSELRDIIEIAKQRDYKDTDKIEKAFVLAKQEYSKKNNNSDTSILSYSLKHNLAVGRTLAELGLDPSTISAGILHNYLIYGCDPDKLRSALGQDVFKLVEYRTKFAISVLSNKSSIEKTKKLLLSLTQDIRLIILELAERYDLLNYPDRLSDKERKKLIEEINQIYLPIARKLGIYQLTSRMEDRLFQNTHPAVYADIDQKIQETIAKRKKFVNEMKEKLTKKLGKKKVPAELKFRNKGVFATYDKMKRKKKKLDEIVDICGLRVITNTIEDCYNTLGIVNSFGEPVPEEFDDYIEKPKANGYRSIHSAIRGKKGNIIEIQIRTHEMNDLAEFGIDAHWRYKSAAEFGTYDAKFAWLREIFEWQNQGEKKKIKTRVSDTKIFVFTPAGGVIEMPDGSTALDFAYYIHSDLGNHCSKARVNGKIVSLDYELENADVVEIVTSHTQKPKRQWLNIAKTDKAKQKIRTFLKIKEKPQLKITKKNLIKVEKADKRIRLAKCCNPLPGDEIIAFSTTKRKISVHVKDCPEGKELIKTKKHVEVDWGKAKENYFTDLTVVAEDRLGILRDLLNVFSTSGIYVSKVGAKARKSSAVCSFDIKVNSLKQLIDTIDKLYLIKGVINVKRGSL